MIFWWLVHSGGFAHIPVVSVVRIFWWLKSKSSKPFKEGVKDFIEFARAISIRGIIACPCLKCCNVEHWEVDKCYGHILRYGFLPGYTNWSIHGENSVPSQPSRPTFGEDEIRSLVRDALGHLPSDSPLARDSMFEDNVGKFSQSSHRGVEDENVGESSKSSQPSRPTFGEDEIRNLVRDALGQIPSHSQGVGDSIFEDNVGESSQSSHRRAEDENGGESSKTSNDSATYKKLLEECDKELYPGCKYSNLSFTLHLYHVKCIGGVSNKTFSMFLELIRDAFPHLTSLPSSVSEAKKLTKDLGLGYEKIDACPNDYMIYWDTRKDQTSCHVCKASRYKSDTADDIGESSNAKKSNKPAKVLQYFPLIPRLKRLYKFEKTTKDMRWHNMGRTMDGKLRHPTDGLAWKGFDARYSDFASDPRSVRLGLASDGVNPFRTMSTTHSTWPVLLIPYNLPPCFRESTRSSWLKYGRKFCYMGHRRWLEQNHKYRFQNDQFDGTCEEEGPPTPLTRFDILEQLSGASFIYGKSDNSSNKSNKRTRDGVGCSTNANDEANAESSAFEDIENFVEEEMGEHLLWKKKSVFFDLEYWKFNLLRHNLDVMHIEKNVCDNFIGTLLNLDGKTKDNENSRKDLMEMGIRHDLHLINRPNKKPYMPPACYTMSSAEKSNFLQVLKNLKVPDGYSSNISRGVSMKDRKLINLKSHDGHILMQDILPIALRVSMLSRAQSRVVKVVYDICLFFKRLCAKVLDPDELDKMESEIALTLCEMEKLFPPSFFTIMVHLTIHLISEAKLGGPVHYRWMYPIERYLMRLKSYVRNRAQPEGSIAEAYIKDECLTFCSRYFEGVETLFNRPPRNDEHILDKEMYILNSGGRKLGKVEIIELDHKLLAQAHRYVILNHSKFHPFRELVPSCFAIFTFEPLTLSLTSMPSCDLVF
ncbi:zinc finger, CCHC-type containing protein [Tanacetum coccineum]